MKKLMLALIVLCLVALTTACKTSKKESVGPSVYFMIPKRGTSTYEFEVK